jgi:hypothetical protein
MDLSISDWVAVISALLAIVSLGLNWLVVRRQTELQYETLRVEMDNNVIEWTHEAIDAVSDGIVLARARGREGYAPGEYDRCVAEASQRLSSIADRGRLFFPNERPNAHGVQKEAAFQGYRPPILDTVVFAHTRLDRMQTSAGGADEESATFLIKCRRLLVSEAQNAIDPRRRGQMLRRLRIGREDDKVSAFKTAAELGEELESLYPGYLERRRDDAWIAEREAMSRRR